MHICVWHEVLSMNGAGSFISNQVWRALARILRFTIKFWVANGGNMCLPCKLDRSPCLHFHFLALGNQLHFGEFHLVWFMILDFLDFWILRPEALPFCTIYKWYRLNHTLTSFQIYLVFKLIFYLDIALVGCEWNRHHKSNWAALENHYNIPRLERIALWPVEFADSGQIFILVVHVHSTSDLCKMDTEHR